MIQAVLRKFKKDASFGELVKGFGVSFILKGLGIVTAFAFTWYVARRLGAESLGIFTIVASVANIGVIIGRMGFNNSLVKLIASQYSKGKYALSNLIFQKSIKLTVLFGFATSTLLFIFAHPIARQIFDKPFLGSYFKLASFAIIPIIISHVIAAYLRGAKEIMKFAFIVDFAHHFFRLIIFAFAIIFVMHVGLPVYSWMMSWVLLMITAAIFYIRIAKLKSLKVVKDNVIGTMPLLKLSFPMFLTSSMHFLLIQTDNIMIGIFAETEEVGIYRVAVQIATVASITLFANRAMAAPKFAEMYEKKDMKGLKHVIQQSTLLVLFSSLPLILGILFFSDFLLSFFGGNFVIAKTALIILTLSQLINSFTGLVGIILIMTGKHVVVQNIMLFCALLNLVLNFIFIQYWGIAGAAIATTVSMTLKNLIAFYYVRKHLGFYSIPLRAVFFDFKKPKQD